MEYFINSPLPAVVIIILSLIAIIMILRSLTKNNYFFCPSCYRRFRASAKQVIFSRRVCDENYLKCPYCGKKNFMRQINEENPH